MSTTRRPLGSLAAYVNVGGEDSLRRRVGPERTPVERQTSQMYERREEAWRPLNRRRVAAFIRLFMLCFVYTENGHQLQPVTYKMLKKALIKRIIPWIYRRLVYTMNEEQWPISMNDFKQLDQYLADHLPRTHRDDPWGTVAYFFKEVVRRREEYQRLEELEREAMEAFRRCLGH